MIEELVRLNGEEYRALITDAIKFLEENEYKWGLEFPIDKVYYIECLINSQMG